MNVLSAYDALVAAGELKPDPEQAAAARRLAALRAQLVAQAKPGLLTRLLGKTPSAPRGIYLWGGVGRGTSMLMDLFHERLAIAEKRRVHFHEFMIEVHARLREARKSETGDPIPPVAAAIAQGVQIGRAHV